MLLGFLDGQGRAYDLTFATLKRRLMDGEGTWAVDPGETLRGGVSLEAAMFLEAPRPHLLLAPTSGTAYASDRRLLFVAAEAVERTPEEPTRFQVAVRVPRTAVEHLFRAQGGREVVEAARQEIRGATEARSELTLRIEAPWVGGPGPAAFLLVLRPLRAAREAVAPLAL